MRYAFGLLGLLITVAIIVKLFADYTAPVAKVGAAKTEEARQMAGRDAGTGEAATNALTLEPATRGGKVIGMTVKAVVAGSSIQTYYGLQANDVITQAGEAPMSEPFVPDADTASGWILKAYQEKRELAVQRGTQKLMLPQANAPAVPSVPTPTAAAPAADPLAAPTPAPNPPAQPGGLQKQLDLIRNSGGQ